MPNFFCLTARLATLLVSVSLPAGAQAIPSTPAASPSAGLQAGLWAGSLATGGMALRLAVHISVTPSGGYHATMDSLDQGALGIPIQTTTFDGKTLTLTLTKLNAQFVGTLSADSKTLAGTWTQGGGTLPLTLTRTDTLPPGPRRPQEPHPPFPYVSRDVVYPNSSGGVVLAGTLTEPQGTGPFPAAILITGSGDHNRDETIFGHKSFLVIADYLTRRGVAVLRVDDRGVGGSTGSKSQSTDHDFASDVRAGVAFLARQPEINPHRIGLIGHSEGGLIAPLAAAGDKSVAFIVLLAGPGVPGPQILREQEALILKSQGADPALIAFAGNQQAQTIHILQTTPDNTQAKAKLDTLLQENLSHLPASLQSFGAQYQANYTAQEGAMLTPWFRGFLQSNPAPVLKQVRCPVLALGGSKDLQVPAAQSLHAIAAALHAGGSKDVTVRELPGLNHLFQTAPTGAISEYAQIEETFSPAALKIMGDWIVQHTRPAAPKE